MQQHQQQLADAGPLVNADRTAAICWSWCQMDNVFTTDLELTQRLIAFGANLENWFSLFVHTSFKRQ